MKGRLYSIAITSVSIITPQGGHSHTVNTPHNIALHTDPAHELAVSLLKDAHMKKIDTQGLTLRHPNMDHSFGAMFTDIPRLNSK